MGLSSSQARLLNLTGRMHDIEYKAAKLEAQKLQMANESRRVYDDYLVALDKTKIQLKTLNNDGSIDYIDATYNRIMNAGYKLSSAGRIVVSQADVDYFNNVANGNAQEFACLKTGYAVKDGGYTVLASNHDICLAFNETELKTLAAADKNITLMNDMTISTKLATNYSKNLNGNGKTITLTGTEGLFTNIKGGKVENLNIDAQIVCNKSGNFGLIAEESKSSNITLENISLSGSIVNHNTGICNIGGLIGRHTSSELNISNITNNLSITSDSNNTDSKVAGLVGSEDSGKLSIDKVYQDIIINGNMAKTGGVLGFSSWSATNCTITNCYSKGDLTSYKIIGGIIGNGGDSTVVHVENCYTSGEITATISDSEPYSGGIIGIASMNLKTYEVENCYTDVTFVNHTNLGSIIGIPYQSSHGTLKLSNCADNNSVIQRDLMSPSNPSDVTINFEQASSPSAVKNAVQEAITGAGASLSVPYSPPITGEYTNFYEIGLAIQEDRVLKVDGMEDNTEWLTNMINGGEIILQKPDGKGNYYDTSVAIDTSLQEVSDESELRKAEAKYEADMKKIDMKDRKYDAELAALDNERNAIKSEMETLKTVAKDNVERTFKLFG